jgi:hypothetical protein
LFDTGENGGQVGQHFVVAEAQDPVAIGFEVFSSRGVLLGLLIVDGTIDFNNKLRGWAIEVEHKRSNGVLAAEAQTSNSSAPQSIPQHTFCRGQLTPQLSGSLPQRLRHTTHTAPRPPTSHTATPLRSPPG